ncbi:MAG: hypothetical protein IMZ64_00845 [Bacteroidetes bacterium]|nr:hypothetical protein [Bacteroidota bacterium]
MSCYDPSSFIELTPPQPSLIDYRGTLFSSVPDQDQLTRQYHAPGEDSFSYGDPMNWIQMNKVLSSWTLIKNEPIIINTEQPDNSIFEGLFMFRDIESVNSFLDQHPELPQYLTDAKVTLDSIFGQGTEYILDIFCDPESNHTNLSVNIRPKSTIDKALDHLDQFDRQWYLKHIKQIGQILTFNLEFP